MKKELSWGDGLDSIIFDMETRQRFSYEENYNEIHKLYGGKLFYRSQTGLTGKGYIERVESLLELGVYRIDTAYNQLGIEVKNNINCFVPIQAHKGIDIERPIVLSNGECVIFAPHYDLLQNIINFYNPINFKKEIKINHKYFDLLGNEYNNEYKLVILEDAPTGVDALRFIDYAQSLNYSNNQHYESHNLEIDSEGLFGNNLNISKVSRPHADDLWVHHHKLGYIDKIWYKNPREIKGEIVNGWYGDGEGLFWRRRDLEVDVFMEVKTDSIEDGKWAVDDILLTEFEKRFSVVEFYHMGIQHVRIELLEEIIKKAESNYEFQEEQKLRSINFIEPLKDYTTLDISIEDAREAGNCFPGIERFIEQWELKLDDGKITIGELLEHPNINDMLKNWDFKRTIIYKLKSKGFEFKTSESNH